MAKETSLVTVPSFLFDNGVERSIQVVYYNGSIELIQSGTFDPHDRIVLDPDSVKDLFKAITANLPEATEYLNRKP